MAPSASSARSEREDSVHNVAITGLGIISSLGLNVDDCQKTYEQLTAKGVEFLQPPSQRPYGTEALCRDNSGNWLVLIEPSNRPVSADDFKG